MFKPSSDWISAFPVEDEVPQHRLPPARSRTQSGRSLRNAAAAPQAITPEIADLAIPGPEPEPLAAGEACGETEGGATYEVGYCKPPTNTRFKAGQSGNPRGRPRAAKGLNTIVRETLGSKVSVRTPSGTKKISKIEAVLQKTLEKALKGDARAQLELMKLWRNAVPDPLREAVTGFDEPERLTAGDLAILEAYRADTTVRGSGSC